MIFGGVTPTTESLEIILNKELGVDYFLERRELESLILAVRVLLKSTVEKKR